MRKLGKYWIRSFGRNTTLVEPVPGHFDIPLVTPSSTPGVLNDPEVMVVFRSISNSQHTVVESISTSEVIEDTTPVILNSVCIDGYGNWSNGSYQRIINV